MEPGAANSATWQLGRAAARLWAAAATKAALRLVACIFSSSGLGASAACRVWLG